MIPKSCVFLNLFLGLKDLGFPLLLVLAIYTNQGELVMYGMLWEALFEIAQRCLTVMCFKNIQSSLMMPAATTVTAFSSFIFF